MRQTIAKIMPSEVKMEYVMPRAMEMALVLLVGVPSEGIPSNVDRVCEGGEEGEGGGER